ncbi:prepilin-type N-terminal cleavage/methylation domain-containing protein [Candidatus Nomurabacteria bacterium]|nr:prepilin-type N-terminal cleavage/methylation domain-containing protein [Candidatus Nomurabacteria bacterium]USN94492.1 MAG: prepilin-type N-terminal cleavage/methylation domain-containing protein [Candidatus Nomurabacteria bacterium]
MINHANKNQKGFTLAEVLVAVSLFTIIMISAIGALLSSNFSYRRSESIKSSLDAVSYTLEDITRNTRTALYIRCDSGASYPETGDYPASFSDPILDSETVPSPADCDPDFGNWGISFESAYGDEETPFDQFSYKIVTKGENAKIYRSRDGGNTYLPLLPNNVYLDPQETRFLVFGTGVDGIQPYVTITLSGYATYKDYTSPFSYQSTVSLRFIDYEI